MRNLTSRDPQKLPSLGLVNPSPLGFYSLGEPKFIPGVKPESGGRSEGLIPFPAPPEGSVSLTAARPGPGPGTPWPDGSGQQNVPSECQGRRRTSSFQQRPSGVSESISTVVPAYVTARQLPDTPSDTFRRLLVIFRPAFSTQASDVHCYKERGDGGRRKTHSYCFYCVACDVLAGFAHVPPSACLGPFVL